MEKPMVIKGNILFTKTKDRFEIHPNSYLVAVDGKVEGVYSVLPERLKGVTVHDYKNRMIIPGFVDLHVHAPQFLQMGTGMNKPLLEWLKAYTFDLETKFLDLGFAQAAYQHFVDELIANGTLRACIFATSSAKSTEILFEIIKKAGIGAYVGKVDMDQNGPKELIESTENALVGTRYLIEHYGNEPRVKPIITPRFAPSCTRKLLDGLGELARQYKVPVQSHVGETKREVEWVRELFPKSKNYLDVYGRSGLLDRAIMAHGIYMTEEEIEEAKARGVYLIHCPDSNINIQSGIMPLREYLDRGMKLGLGSDVAGGHAIALKEQMVRAIQLSKIRRFLGESVEPIQLSEAFYLGTKGGGSFFGKTGSFEPGFWLDALVIEDHPLIAETYTLEERLEKFIYSGERINIIAKYVEGHNLSSEA